MDVSNSPLTEFLFSCKTCEVPMTSQEKREHGLPPEEDIKSFNALVADGAAAGILGNLPKFKRHTMLSTCPEEIRKNKRLMNNPGHVKALRNLVTQCRAAVRFEMGKTRRRASKIFVDLAPEKVTTTGFTEAHVNYLRIFLDPRSCLCGSETSAHSSKCA